MWAASASCWANTSTPSRAAPSKRVDQRWKLVGNNWNATGRRPSSCCANRSCLSENADNRTPAQQGHHYGRYYRIPDFFFHTTWGVQSLRGCTPFTQHISFLAVRGRILYSSAHKEGRRCSIRPFAAITTTRVQVHHTSCGPESYEVAAKVFDPASRPKVADAKAIPPYSSQQWRGRELSTEAAVFRAPHGYTGEDVVDTTAAVLSPGGWWKPPRQARRPLLPTIPTRLAFLNGKLSLTSRGRHGHHLRRWPTGGALANASLNGALARKIAAQKDALTALQAHLAAWVDFPEEDVGTEPKPSLRRFRRGEQELDALIQATMRALSSARGVDCAIVGKPNAGQIHPAQPAGRVRPGHCPPVAGTTRDVVERLCSSWATSG